MVHVYCIIRSRGRARPWKERPNQNNWQHPSTSKWVTLSNTLVNYIAARVPPKAGPELRQALDLFRVINRTGLQIREGIELESEPCGRLYAGDVFCVNRSSTIPHHHCSNDDGRQGKRHLVRLTRLHVVQPYTGWVTGSPKWVEKFQQGGSRPGPVPLPSTLSDICPALMVDSLEGESTSRCNSSKMGARHWGTEGTHSYEDSKPMDADRCQELKAQTPRTKWLHSRWT